jgi:hypothetical protein
MNEHDPRDTAEFQADLWKIAVPFLVERLGGEVLITEVEYEAFMARHRATGEPPSVLFERTPQGMRLSISTPS